MSIEPGTVGDRASLVIAGVDAYEVTVPIEAPIRHSYGVHEALS
ncbi:hypothetical protein ACIBL3_37280 [Kribbella sp. NPDC050124]